MAGKIRNVALAGHGGSGKTSLAEALLYTAGAIDRLGRVENGNTVCDYDPEEIKRVNSVSATVASFAYGSTKINLIDTPGLFDFATGLYEGVRAVESVLITVSGKSGVTVGTEKAYKLARQADKACMFFVGKLDAEHADFYKVLEELKGSFGPSVCPLVAPIYDGHNVTGYVNLVDNKAYKYSDGEASEITMPDMGHRLEGLRTALAEAIAETDEALFEKYFSGESFTRDEILSGIHKGVKSGSIAPVFCGSATTLAGVDMVLDAIVDHLPSAYESGAEQATDSKGEQVLIACTDEAPLAAFVFKTVADPFVGKLSFVKVVSGKLSTDIAPVNARTGSAERMGKLLYICGKKQEDTAFVTAGDICAVTKLSEAVTGDSLCDPSRVVSFEPIAFPKATLTMAIVTKKKGDEGKIAQAIARLIEEDPIIAFDNNIETKQMTLSGLGDQHIDMVASKLRSKFGLDIGLEKPRVPYRETIRKKVKVQGRHKKQSGGHGQFGDVWIEFEPGEGEGLTFEEKIFGGSVPRNFFPAVEKGLQEAITRGTLAGYPMVGIKATLVDGSYHAVDSSEMAFKLAAHLAYKAGIPQAAPVLLEPIGKLMVHVPDSYTGDIMGDLNKRRGRILGMHPGEDGLQTIEAEVPMSEMHDFTTALRSMTQGRGNFSLTFERYEELPKNLEAGVIEDAKVLFENE